MEKDSGSFKSKATVGAPSIVEYDKDTDNDIFALGDAASKLDNLDDLFGGFGVNINDVLHGEAPDQLKVDTYTIPPPNAAPSEQTEGSEKNKVQVSTISQTLPDGRKVHTRVIKGPVRCTKRVMKIMKETPNGPELLATVEVPPGGDVNSILESIPQALIGGDRGPVKILDGDYDNIPLRETPGSPHLVLRSPDKESKPPEDSFAAAAPRSTIQSPKKKVQINDLQPIEESEDIKSYKKSSFKNRRMSLKRKLSVSVQDLSPIRRLSPSKSHSLPEEEAIQLYEPPDESTDNEFYAEEKSDCFSCLPCKKLRAARKHMIKPKIENLKGKSGMTASDISDNRELPGLQALVANYARMLHEDKAQFVETLFRAVKLNKLDVTRILCKITQKSGFQLSSNELREPESSATILHVALLYNHDEIIDFLLEQHDSNLILAKYETVEYHNQTGLHVAVANGNPKIVEKLLLALDDIDRQILINTVADGKYFLSQHPHGQLCLTAAAWAGNGDVIKILAKHGGHMGLKDHVGNTLIHSIILQSAKHPERNNYEYLFSNVWDASGVQAEDMVSNTKNAHQRELEHRQMQINIFKQLLTIRNNDGYTPLGLAAAVTSRLYGYMLNLEKIYKIPQNKLGSIAWVTYDVTDITSYARDSYNKYSVLHILAHNSKQLSHHANMDRDNDDDLLGLEPVMALLTCKWAVYRWIYIVWLVIHLIYMVFLTALTAEANSSSVNISREKYGRITSHYLSEKTEPVKGFAFFLIIPVAYVILEILDLLGNRPYRIQFMAGMNYFSRLMKSIKSEWTITGNGPYRAVNIGFSFFTIMWFFLYVMNHPDQDMALAMSLLLGWIFVLFFTRGCRVTCRFSIMIQMMFFRDLIYFLTVYGIVLLGFSFAMNAMFSYMGNADVTINQVFYDMMNVVTDLDTKQSIDDARHPVFAKLLLILYAIVAVILLMNMLIAMMNTSYETIRVTRCNLWKQQQLSIMLMMERRFFWWKWLCRSSERDIWKRDSDDGIRCYMDVTMLHTPGYKFV